MVVIGQTIIGESVIGYWRIQIGEGEDLSWVVIGQKLAARAVYARHVTQWVVHVALAWQPGT